VGTEQTSLRFPPAKAAFQPKGGLQFQPSNAPGEVDHPLGPYGIAGKSPARLLFLPQSSKMYSMERKSHSLSWSQLLHCREIRNALAMCCNTTSSQACRNSRPLVVSSTPLANLKLTQACQVDSHSLLLLCSYESPMKRIPSHGVVKFLCQRSSSSPPPPPQRAPALPSRSLSGHIHPELFRPITLPSPTVTRAVITHSFADLPLGVRALPWAHNETRREGERERGREERESVCDRDRERDIDR
jgi:hypothetical protein